MKKILLSLIILQNCNHIYAELTNGQKTVIAAGAAGATFLWFWNRESNETKINRANNLYQDCQFDIGKHTLYTIGDPELGLQKLLSTAIMRKNNEIRTCYKDIKGRLSCFWNRSIELSEAFRDIKKIEKSLTEYEYVENQLKQQILINKTEALWSQLSRFIISSRDYVVIYNSTLRQLLTNVILKQKDTIKSLYTGLKEYHLQSQQSKQFDEAYKHIGVLYENVALIEKVIEEIEVYEYFLNKYKTLLIINLKDSFDLKNVVVQAASLSSSRYPLINFASELKEDIKRLKKLTLHFAYSNNTVGLDSEKHIDKDAKELVSQKLHTVLNIVLTDMAYRQEQHMQEEQRMHEERMRIEQERLRIERERLRAEQLRAQAERLRAKAELKKAENYQAVERKKLQEELDNAYLQAGKNSYNTIEKELDRAYDFESGLDKNSWW